MVSPDTTGITEALLRVPLDQVTSLDDTGRVGASVVSQLILSTVEDDLLHQLFFQRPGIIRKLEEIEFLAPVFQGELLNLTWSVLDREEHGKNLVVHLSFEVSKLEFFHPSRKQVESCPVPIPVSKGRITLLSHYFSDIEEALP
mgnify:CR=1 FL=1